MSGVSVYVESPSGAFVRDAKCDLCGADEVELLATRDRRGKPLRTVVCTRCGLLSHESIPSDEELADYYAHEYRHAYHGEGQPSAKRVLRAWNVGRAIYQRVQSFVHPGDRVFEIGAGLGCTVKAFDLEGFEASGIEPGVEFQSFSRGTLHADIENARLEDLAPVPAYDFVLLVHVIEHFSQPTIDPIQRLDPDASMEDTYSHYIRHVKIGFDPTEGIVKMEVIAADPEVSAAFSRALITYAEAQVDNLSLRLREDQM